MKEKILIVLPFIPYPLNTGGNQGTFHMLNYIKDYFDIYIWFHINSKKKSSVIIQEFSEALNNKCHIYYTENRIGINFITFRAIYRKLNHFFLKKDVEYLHNELLWGDGTTKYCNVGALEDICNIINDNNIKIVQLEYSMILDLVYALPAGVKKIFIHHELAFARHETMINNLKRQYVYDKYCYNKQYCEEILALNQFDCIVTMSDLDKDKLKSAGVVTRLESSPSFIPVVKKEYPSFVPAQNRLVYIASGKHYPNVEGLKWFLDNVHPILRYKCNYILDIIGSGWDISALGKEVPSNFIFKGFIEDLSSVIPGAIMVVPILSGSGMRMKILESVNNSVPFVSTSVGAEGLLFKNLDDCYIEDESQLFAEKIVELLADTVLQRRFVDNCRAVYEKNYSPLVQANKRLAILKSLI